MLTAFNRIAYYFTDLGNLLEILGAAFIFILPTAIIFFYIGYHTRWVMEPIRVRQAKQEKDRALLMCKGLQSAMHKSLALYNKSDIESAKARHQYQMAEELSTLASFSLLEAIDSE